jgi:hypothetical protein
LLRLDCIRNSEFDSSKGNFSNLLELKPTRQRTDSFDLKSNLAIGDKFRSLSVTNGDDPLVNANVPKPSDVSMTPEIKKSKSLTKKIKQLSSKDLRVDSPSIVAKEAEIKPLESHVLEKVPIPMLTRSISNSSPLNRLSLAATNEQKERDIPSLQSISIEQLEAASISTAVRETPTKKLNREIPTTPQTSQSVNLSRTAAKFSTVITNSLPVSAAASLAALKSPQAANNDSDKTEDHQVPLYHHFSLPKSLMNTPTTSSHVSTFTSLNQKSFGMPNSSSKLPNRPNFNIHESLLDSSPQAPTFPSNNIFSNLPSAASKTTDKATFNDKILQEKLQEAKALNRKDDNGATMHKFSLWSKKPDVQQASAPVTPAKASEEIESDKHSATKSTSRLRGPKIAREAHSVVSGQDDTHSLSHSHSTATFEKDLGKGFVEENSRDQADLSFLQERSSFLDVSNLEGSANENDISNCGNSYSDEEFVKIEDESTFLGKQMEEPGSPVPSSSTSKGGSADLTYSNSVSKGLASSLRNKVVGAKKLAIDSPTSANLHFSDEKKPDKSHSKVIKSNSKVLKRLDFSSFHENEVPDELESSFNSLMERQKLSSNALTSLCDDIDCVDDEQTSSHGSDSDSIEEEDHINRIGISRSQSFNIDTDSVAPSIQTIMSRSGPATFASLSTQFQDDAQSVETETTRTRRAVSLAENKAGIAYNNDASIIQSLTSRDKSNSLRNLETSTESQTNKKGTKSSSSKNYLSSSSTNPKTGEKLSKYQKLRNLRTIKKQRSNDKEESPEQVSIEVKVDSVPVADLTAENLALNAKASETTDREESNSSPVLSELSNDESLAFDPKLFPPPRNLQKIENIPSFNRPAPAAAPSSSSGLKPIDNKFRECMTSSPIQWIQGEAIGEGTFGKVFKGLNQKTGELLAIKQMYLTDGSQKEVEELQKEINVMWELDHENIVRYLGTSRNEKCLFIILEYVTGGSIASMLTQFGFFRENLLR